MSVERDEVESAKGREPVVRRSALAALLQDIRLLLVAMWLGASLFFSFALAPSVFRVLRDSTALYANHLAGTIVTRNLAVINTSGLLLSLLLLASAFLFRRGKPRAAFLAEVVSLVVLAVATSLGQWLIAARMLALRAQMGRPIDETAANDPVRVAFDSLHVYSVGALLAAMLAALVAFILIARRARRV
ncbi:MAG TPA: DUF4149 domain-containing protein [Pyrinomonadaceae bacterium]|nr:DUF4149 domain-containing protein [Pyrinomonadaceae bacterium]